MSGVLGSAGFSCSRLDHLRNSVDGETSLHHSLSAALALLTPRPNVIDQDPNTVLVFGLVVQPANAYIRFGCHPLVSRTGDPCKKSSD